MSGSMLMVTKKELANAYGIHRNTLAKRVNELGIKKAARLTPKDLALIFEEFGPPKAIKKPITMDGFKEVG